MNRQNIRQALVDKIPLDKRSKVLNYKLKGTTLLRIAGEKMNEEVGLAFDTIKFADKNVLMYNDKNALIMSKHGVEKFKTTFKKSVTDIIPLDSDTDFLVTYNDRAEEIELD